MFQLDAHMHVLSPDIQSVKNAAVVDLSCFHSTKYSLQEFLDVKKEIVIFLSQKYAWELRKMKYEQNAPIKNIYR